MIYKIVSCCKRRRTLNRLQSHYQLREPGSGILLSTRYCVGHSFVFSWPTISLFMIRNPTFVLRFEPLPTGLLPSSSRQPSAQAGIVTQPVSVKMQPLNENGSLAREPSDEPFASLNPLSQRRKAGGGAAAGTAGRSRVAARGGRESPEAVEMQLTAARGSTSDTQIADDDFSDFVGAEDPLGTDCLL